MHFLHCCRSTFHPSALEQRCRASSVRVAPCQIPSFSLRLRAVRRTNTSVAVRVRQASSSIAAGVACFSLRRSYTTSPFLRSGVDKSDGDSDASSQLSEENTTTPNAVPAAEVSLDPGQLTTAPPADSGSSLQEEVAEPVTPIKKTVESESPPATPPTPSDEAGSKPTESDTEEKTFVKEEKQTEEEWITSDSKDEEKLAEVADRLRDAETSIHLEEVFDQDNFQQFIHTTEVSTTQGLRWLDMSASPEFFRDPMMSRVPEGQFAYSVMRKIFGSRFPIGVYASVVSGPALPATYVDENWACLILRATKETHQLQDDVAHLLRRVQQEHNEAAAAQEAEDTAAALASGRRSFSGLIAKKWTTAFRGYSTIETAGSATGDLDKVYYDDEGKTHYYSQDPPLSHHWVRQLRRRVRQVLHGEKSPSINDDATTTGSTTTATAAPTATTTSFSGSSTSRRSKKPPISKSRTAEALRRMRQRPRQPPTRSPLTMNDFTDRLTIFIGKELHPIEEDRESPQAVKVAGEVKDAYVLSLDMDQAYSFHGPSTEDEDTKTQQTAKRGGDASASSTAAPRYEVRWRVITVHRSPISFIREMQSQWNTLTARGASPSRTLRTVSAHRHEHFDAQEDLDQILRKAARPADMNSGMEDDDAGELYGTTVDRMEGWEDLVRLLYHGAARTLQESAYRNTRRLELMETAIFDTADNSTRHLHSMTQLMAELHLLSRKATIHNAILRESKVAYERLKRVLDSPVDLADQRELLYVDSVLSISAALEEQSESLLFLQFSVAMNQTESHLRTLTIFSTLFIPLDFICTCCGLSFESAQRFHSSESAMYAVFGMLATTAVLTMRWIRHNLG